MGYKSSLLWKKQGLLPAVSGDCCLLPCPQITWWSVQADRAPGSHQWSLVWLLVMLVQEGTLVLACPWWTASCFFIVWGARSPVIMLLEAVGGERRLILLKGWPPCFWVRMFRRPQQRPLVDIVTWCCCRRPDIAKCEHLSSQLCVKSPSEDLLDPVSIHTHVHFYTCIHTHRHT